MNTLISLESVPAISVITIVYNQEAYIAEAIESVARQNYTNYEYIIVDDGSTDHTQDIIKKYAASDSRIRFFCNETNQGISRSRNRALSLAQGKYCAVLDSDDIWTDSEKLSHQVAFLEDPTHAQVGLLGTSVMIFRGSPSQPLSEQPISYPTDDTRIRNKILMRNQFVHSSVVFRTAIVRSVGGYREEVSGVEDYELWLKIGLTHTFANLPSFTVRYRLHEQNITQTKRHKHAQLLLSIVKNYKGQYPGYFRAVVLAYIRILRSYFF